MDYSGNAGKFYDRTHHHNNSRQIDENIPHYGTDSVVGSVVRHSMSLEQGSRQKSCHGQPLVISASHSLAITQLCRRCDDQHVSVAKTTPYFDSVLIFAALHDG